MSGEVDPLRSFELRAWARAYLLRVGEFDNKVAAFEQLWAAGKRDGLYAQYGGDVLLQIINKACDQVGV